MAVQNSYRATTRSDGPCYMDPRFQRSLRHPNSTPRTQPSRGQGSKPSGSKNQAPPLSLPRLLRTQAALASRRPNPPRAAAPQGCARHPPAEPALRRRPQGCARRPPAEPALHRRPVLRAPAAAAGTRGPRTPHLPRTCPAPSPRPCGLRPEPPERGLRRASPPANAPCAAAPPCGLRPPPPGPAQGGADAGHRRRDMRRLRARPPPPSFRDFRKYFWGFFVLHVGGQIPRDLFEEIVARTFVSSFGLIRSQISHGFGLDLEFSPKLSSS